MFGGEKFVAIIGHLSLAKDMKTALQDDDEEPEASTSTGEPGAPAVKKVLTPEEKAKKDEKNQRIIAQVHKALGTN